MPKSFIRFSSTAERLQETQILEIELKKKIRAIECEKTKQPKSPAQKVDGELDR